MTIQSITSDKPRVAVHTEVSAYAPRWEAWGAWSDNYDEGSNVGRGASEIHALQDLATQQLEADNLFANAETLDALEGYVIALHAEKLKDTQYAEGFKEALTAMLDLVDGT